MIDQARLERVLSSWKRADANSFSEFFDMILKSFESVQSGLMTSNEFSQIKFLQGVGAIISVMLASGEKIMRQEQL